MSSVDGTMRIRSRSENRFQVSLPLITDALPFRSLRMRFEELNGTLVDLKAAVLYDVKRRKVLFDVATR